MGERDNDKYGRGRDDDTKKWGGCVATGDDVRRTMQRHGEERQFGEAATGESSSDREHQVKDEGWWKKERE